MNFYGTGRTCRAWLRLATNNFSTLMATKLSFFCYLSGKVVRFIFYLVFLFSLMGQSKVLAGYSRYEVLVFFLTFNFIDITAQIFFRGTYAIGHGLIARGRFDHVLLKPFSPLLHSISHLVDFIDLATWLVLLPFLLWAIAQVQGVERLSLLLYAMLLLGGLLIATAFHILAASVAIITFESHHVMFLYRNLGEMLRFPIDIYPPALQVVMTSILPVGVMIAFPVKGLLGELSFWLVLYAFLLAIIFFWCSLRTWSWALRHYQSASS